MFQNKLFKQVLEEALREALEEALDRHFFIGFWKKLPVVQTFFLPRWKSHLYIQTNTHRHNLEHDLPNTLLLRSFAGIKLFVSVDTSSSSDFWISLMLLQLLLAIPLSCFCFLFLWLFLFVRAFAEFPSLLFDTFPLLRDCFYSETTAISSHFVANTLLMLLNHFYDISLGSIWSH